MKKCGKECYPLCDFCRFYNFNPGLSGCYMGKGFCIFHNKPMEPEDDCEDFICENYKRLSSHKSSVGIMFLDKKYEKHCIKKQKG
jgi:hypothetical protein